MLRLVRATCLRTELLSKMAATVWKKDLSSNRFQTVPFAS